MASFNIGQHDKKQDVNVILERMKKEFALGLKSELLPDELADVKE